MKLLLALPLLLLLLLLFLVAAVAAIPAVPAVAAVATVAVIITTNTVAIDFIVDLLLLHDMTYKLRDCIRHKIN